MKRTKDVTENADNVRRLSAENRKLRRSVEELSLLNDLSLAISGNSDPGEIIHTVIERAVCLVGANRGNITLMDEQPEDPIEAVTRGACSPADSPHPAVDKQVRKWMRLHKKPLLLNHTRNTSPFEAAAPGSTPQYLLAVPLMTHSRLIGVLAVYGKKGGEGFSGEDKRLLSIIASHSAQVIENARLHRKERDLEEMRREVKLASRIQNQLLPGETPDIEGYELHGRTMSSRGVGGDYYDFIKLDRDRWVLCLGDVSGKGLPASLLTSNLQAHIRGELPCHTSPGILLEKANTQLYESTEPEKFATLFIGILNSRTHSLTYSLGGHEYPFLLRSGKKMLRLKSGGLPLGVTGGQEYEEKSIVFRPGDKLVVYSDGITDNRDGEGKAFGEKGLKRTLQSGNDHSPSHLLSQIFESSLAHGEGSKPFDDMTGIVLGRNSR